MGINIVRHAGLVDGLSRMLSPGAHAYYYRLQIP
jgi:hypothetical protein